MSKIKPIAEVIRAPEPFTGFVVRCTRYPNGRRLPEPRLLVDGGDPKSVKPFATAFQAMEVMRDWRDNPASVHVLRPTDCVGNPVREAPEPKAKPVTSRDKPLRRPIPVRPAKALPPVVKLMPDIPAQCLKPRDRISQELHDDIEFQLLSPTKCPTRVGRGVKEQYRKHGGVTPMHLNPLTMGES